MPQKTHTMHGRDHCPGGSDPIPCLLAPTVGGEGVETVIRTLGDLTLYYRCGEPGTTDDLLDTSEFDATARDLTYTENSSATDWNVANRPDRNVPHPETTGDDGCVDFVYEQPTFSVSAPVHGGVFFHGDTRATVAAVTQNLAAFRNTGTFTKFARTAMGFFKPNLHAVSGSAVLPGWIFGSAAMDGSGSFMDGWGLWWDHKPSNETLNLLVGPSAGNLPKITIGPALDPDVWYHAAVSWDETTWRLYLNGTEVGTWTGGEASSAGNDFSVGRADFDVGVTSNDAFFYGPVDEIAVFSRVLTEAEIAGVYEAGVGTGGSPDAPGKVLTSDGAGGSTWEYVSTGSVADEAVTPAKIEPGTDGYWLTTTGGAVTWAAAPAGGSGDPADDTAAWLPLTTVTGGVPELVWDGDDSLIPTLGALA